MARLSHLRTTVYINLLFLAASLWSASSMSYTFLDSLLLNIKNYHFVNESHNSLNCLTLLIFKKYFTLLIFNRWATELS